MCLAGVPYAHIAPNPTNISHRGISAFHVELIFQAHGEAMQWPNCCFLVGIVCIKVPCPLKRLVEEDLMEAVILE